MARERGKIELTLFPFLSVLCGLIAVLILHIFLTLQAGQAEARYAAAGGTSAGHARGGPDEAKARELDESRKKLLEDLEAGGKLLAKLKHEREVLERLLEMRKNQETIDAGSGTVGEPIGAPVPKRYRIVRATKERGASNKTPVVVEVGFNGYLVHNADGSRQAAPFRAIAADPRTGALREVDRDLVKFLDTINGDRRNKYILLLVQEDGIDALDNLKKYCRTKYPNALGPRAANGDVFDLGVEPFSENWRMLGEVEDSPKPAAGPAKGGG